MPKLVSPFPFLSFFFFLGGGVQEEFRLLEGGGGSKKNEGNPGGVQNSYMDYYEFFRPTPGDKY